MSPEKRYHTLVSTRLASSTTLLLALVLAPALQAQIQAGGLPPSVTSIGFSPSPVAPGIPPSVTSLGFGQQAGLFNHRFCCQFSHASQRPFFHERRHFPGYGGVALPIYSMPYYYPPTIIEPVDDTMERDYGPGPTIFDRRGSSRSNTTIEQFNERLDRLDRLIDEAEAKTEAKAKASPPEPAEEAKAAADQPPTILVFHDGHTLEVKNYAIVGDVLYDFSADRRKKIALAELDLTATQKKNEDRGIDFRLPAHPGN
jgi:hypothetical protein